MATGSLTLPARPIRDMVFCLRLYGVVLGGGPAPVQHHVFVNRGFVTGPVLPIYGFGADLGGAAASHPERRLAVRGGRLGRRRHGIHHLLGHGEALPCPWRDYTGKPFNLNGRIYLLGVVVFGIMMVVIDRVVQPVLKDLTDLVPPPALEVAAAVALAVFLVDLMTSVVHMKNFNKRLAAMQGKVAEMAEGARNRGLRGAQRREHRRRERPGRHARCPRKRRRRRRPEPARTSPTPRSARASAWQMPWTTAATPSKTAWRSCGDPTTPAAPCATRTSPPTRNQEAYRWLKEHLPSNRDDR